MSNLQKNIINKYSVHPLEYTKVIKMETIIKIHVCIKILHVLITCTGI